MATMINEKNSMGRLIGKYCKVVIKEPGDEGSYIIIGVVKDIDHDGGFITIESNLGVGRLNIKSIVAIKPKERIGI